jgi:hypothetical protein
MRAESEEMEVKANNKEWKSVVKEVKVKQRGR